MKKLLAMLLAVVMVLSLAACGSGKTAADTPAADAPAASGAASAGDGKTTVHVALSGSVTEVAPYAATNEYAEPIRNTVFETLFVKPTVSSTETIPVIGKSWEMVDDYTARVEIFDYVHDVDGNPITASDVVYSYQACAESGTQTDTAYIDSMNVVDDYTFEIKLTEVSQPTMLKLLTHIVIVNEEAHKANPDLAIGTSPYKLTAYTAGAEYVCEKTGNYWQTDESLISPYSQANVDKLVFEVITEAAQVTNALENHEIQMAIGADGREAARFEEGGENAEGFCVDTNAGSFSLVLLMNCTDESPCADVNFRKACLYAIDTETIVRIVLNGAGMAAKDMASNQLAGFNEAWLTEDYYNADPAKAQEYLAKSGYNGETIMLEGSNSYSGELELMQAQLSAIGVKAEIQTFENALWQEEKVAGTGTSGWDICVDGLGGSVVTTAWRVKFNPDNFSTGKPQTGYLDEKLQELLTTAHASQDAADIEAVHDYIVDQAYAIGLYYSASKCITVDTITDMVYNHKGFAVPAAANYDAYTITE